MNDLITRARDFENHWQAVNALKQPEYSNDLNYTNHRQVLKWVRVVPESFLCRELEKFWCSQLSELILEIDTWEEPNPYTVGQLTFQCFRIWVEAKIAQSEVINLRSSQELADKIRREEK